LIRPLSSHPYDEACFKGHVALPKDNGRPGGLGDLYTGRGVSLLLFYLSWVLLACLLVLPWVKQAQGNGPLKGL